MNDEVAQKIREILLSDEFVNKFADAVVKNFWGKPAVSNFTYTQTLLSSEIDKPCDGIYIDVT
jgi:hypothetical protein